jgi:hypothetical protein
MTRSLRCLLQERHIRFNGWVTLNSRFEQKQLLTSFKYASSFILVFIFPMAKTLKIEFAHPFHIALPVFYSML